MSKVREVTCYLLELIDNGVLDASFVASTCMNYMSEGDVRDMARMNDMLPESFYEYDDSLDNEED